MVERRPDAALTAADVSASRTCWRAASCTSRGQTSSLLNMISDGFSDASIDSAASLVWVTSDKWGPFKGEMLHMSYGQGTLLHIMTESVNDQIQGGALGIASRTDGTQQLTYNGAPLYLFIGDTQPGDTHGQGSDGVWFVVNG